MGEYLSFVTIDVWTMIFTWANLLILFLLMKKFLFGPVRNIIEKRQEEIETSINEANNMKTEAEKMKEEYEEKLENARDKAEEIVKTATRTAYLKEEEILKDAHKKAADMLEKADKQIDMEKQAALNDVKNEISQMATAVAEKILEKDINEEDHTRLIDEFIKGMGETL